MAKSLNRQRELRLASNSCTAYIQYTKTQKSIDSIAKERTAAYICVRGHSANALEAGPGLRVQELRGCGARGPSRKQLEEKQNSKRQWLRIWWH